MHHFIWVSCSVSKFRKTNNSKKMSGLTEGEKDGQKDGWKDRQTLFYRTYWAFAEGPKSEEKLNPSSPTKIGDSLKKMSFMTIQQHLYFTWLFEVSYSIARWVCPFEEFFDIIELEKLNRVDFSPIVRMKMRVAAETFVLNRFLTKR